MFLGTEINIPSYEANQYRQNIHNAQAPVTKDTNVFIQGEVFYICNRKRKAVCLQLNKRKSGNFLLYFTFLIKIIPTVPTMCRPCLN